MPQRMLAIARFWRWFAWWVVIVDFAGSAAFQISALYGFFPPPPEAGWSWDSNLWAFIGALCFYYASYLMIPELFNANAKVPSKAVTLAAGG